MRDVLQRAREAGLTTLALTADTSWFGNRERDPRNGFTIPPSYSPQQVYHGLLRPAWSLDVLSRPPVRFEVAAADAPAEALTTYFNEMISKDYSWQGAPRLTTALPMT